VRKNVKGANWDKVRNSVCKTINPAILNIGAQAGSSSAKLLEWVTEVHVFEPNPEMLSSLLELANKQSSLSIYPVALADEACEMDFNIHSHSDSSSVLRTSMDYRILYPKHCQVNKTISVKKTKLGRWASELPQPSSSRIALIKIDVQGFERSVLEGERGALKNVNVIVIKVSSFQQYEGVPLVDEISVYLNRLGFRLEFAFDIIAASADFFFIRI